MEPTADIPPYVVVIKFSIKVVTKNVHDGPIGIILSGSPGIGKTHLSVAVAKYVANHGKIVTFVDEEYINSILYYFFMIQKK